MLIRSRFYLRSREGEERVRRKFLWYPRHFGKDRYWVWLTWKLIRERVTKVDIGGSMTTVDAWKWREIGYVEPLEEPKNPD